MHRCWAGFRNTNDKEKAIKSGASKVYLEDVKEEFVVNYIYPTLKSGAIYEGKYLLGTSFARPLIAKKLVEIAHKENAEIYSAWLYRKGNDQVRFEVSIKALDQQLKLLLHGEFGILSQGKKKLNMQ